MDELGLVDTPRDFDRPINSFIRLPRFVKPIASRHQSVVKLVCADMPVISTSAFMPRSSKTRTCEVPRPFVALAPTLTTARPQGERWLGMLGDALEMFGMHE